MCFCCLKKKKDLLFEDIRSDLVGLIFFRAMTAFDEDGDSKQPEEAEDQSVMRMLSGLDVDIRNQTVERVPLWTIRIFLKTISMLQDVAKAKLLDHNRFLLVNEDTLLEMVLEHHEDTVLNIPKYCFLLWFLFFCFFQKCFFLLFCVFCLKT